MNRLKKLTSVLLASTLSLSLCLQPAADEADSFDLTNVDELDVSEADVVSDADYVDEDDAYYAETESSLQKEDTAGTNTAAADSLISDESASVNVAEPAALSPASSSKTADMTAIEEALDLSRMDTEWTYSASSNSWTLSVVTAVTNPEIPDEQGVSVCVPGAYVSGVDTDSDGLADVTAASLTVGNTGSGASATVTEGGSDTAAGADAVTILANSASLQGTAAEAADAINSESSDTVADAINSESSDAVADAINNDGGNASADAMNSEDSDAAAVAGNIIIDYGKAVTSTHGQVYTASTAPVIINTGAAGYSEQTNQTASSTYAAEGYINVACGNRGKQSTLSDGSFTGDAPCCLVDQKNAVRFVKYNILLGNLPGSTDYFVSTGGSGGGAHAAMLAATSDNPDFYDYEIAAGAVGVYKDTAGNYITSVTIGDQDVSLSDGIWGCMAYSAITSLAEADMALAFEYFLDTDYSFNTDFQKKTAEYLAAEYMNYINERNLSVSEASTGFDLNKDGDTDDEAALTIEYDAAAHPETNGYYGTYLDLYLAEFEQSLNDYLERLDYAEDWTWFSADGSALSDEDVAAMTSEDRALAFIEGRYAKGSTGESGGMRGPGGMGGNGGFGGRHGNGEPGGGFGGMPGDMGGDQTEGGFSGMPGDMNGDQTEGGFSGMPGDMGGGQTQEVGTPDAGTTQSAGSSTNSSNYSSFEEMLSAYETDIASVEAGDAYGRNIVQLYNPINYIGAADTKNPAWVRILMGASEGDISMFNSLNLQLAWLGAGTDAQIEWQWDGGHVPSEILGDSLPLYVDMMYGKHVDGAVTITKQSPEGQTANGTSEQATGTDLSSWVTYDSESGAAFALADAAAYRTAGASKAIPGFDVIDYGQEDYVFGNATQDARHWNSYLIKVFQEHAEELAGLF